MSEYTHNKAYFHKLSSDHQNDNFELKPIHDSQVC